MSDVVRLRVRGTFIDVDSRGPALSPRASSEPRRPAQDRLYIEEQQRYVARLYESCSQEWSGGRGDSPRRFRVSQEPEAQQRKPLVTRRPPPDRGSEQASASPPSSASRATRPPPPVEPRERFARDSSAEDRRRRRRRPEARAAGTLQGVPTLSLAELLGNPGGGRAASPCGTERSNAGSGSEWVSEASTKTDRSVQHRGRQPDTHGSSAGHMWCSTTVCSHVDDAASACHGDAEVRRHWLGGPVACSEPGYERQRSRPFAQWKEQRKEQSGAWEKENTPRRAPLQQGAQASLAFVRGKWLVTESTEAKLEGGIWTIEDDGRAFFNGQRLSSLYDIVQHSSQEGAEVIQRGDGWTVTSESLGSDQLVWTKAGELKDVIWTRTGNPSDPHTPRRSRVSHTELRSKMQATAQQMSDGWGSTGRLSSAVAVIEEIPMRISEDMQRAASYVVDNMQSEVAAMSKQIRGSDWGSHHQDGCGADSSTINTEKVIKNLEVIPTMVQNLLEARVKKARDKVRHRVHGMIQNLSVIQEENWEDHEQLVSQMRLISEEVEKIAGDAVKAAAEECHAHASRQLDFALHALRDRREPGQELPGASDPAERPCGASESLDAHHAAAGRVTWEVTHDPEFWPKTVAAADWAKDTMEQAVAVVKDKDYIPQSITNQVVADELLRARIRSGGGANRGPATAAMSRCKAASHLQSSFGAASAVVDNPGSRGHPDFCPRPCAYHVQGRCKNGSECLFCHLPHPKRPVRFDKQHRDELRRMSFGQLAETLVPTLRQRAQELQFPPEVSKLLHALWPALERETEASKAEEAALAPIEASCAPPSPTGAPFAATSVPSAAVSSNASATGSESRSSRQRGSFGGAFHVMGFRSLLAMLTSKVPEESVETRELVESVLSKIREGKNRMHALGPGSCPGGIGNAAGVVPVAGGMPRRGGRRAQVRGHRALPGPSAPSAC